MGKIVLFSAANRVAAQNLQRSVVDGLTPDILSESRMFDEFAARLEGGKIRLWGSPSGSGGRKLASWRRIEPAAVAFFYTAGGFRFVARVWAKEPPTADGYEGNPHLARTVWGDDAFENIVYLDKGRGSRYCAGDPQGRKAACCRAGPPARASQLVTPPR